MHIPRRLSAIAAAAAIALTVASCARSRTGFPPPPPPPPPAPVSVADSIAAAEAQRRHIPGLALVVMRGDSVLLARGYGRIDIARSDGVTPTTVFQLGSISKQFLAALVTLLAHEGALSLDDPVARLLPGFTHLPEAIRVRHLLTHTSGLREIFTLPEAGAAYTDLAVPRDSFVAALRRLPADWAAGARWSYSNTNYNLLALLVEQVTGKPYEDVLAERFFRPLGLTTLRHCTSLPLDDHEARGHGVRGGVAVSAPPENMNWIRGDGGLCGGALDVARWTRLLHSGRVLPRAAHTRMVTPAPFANGRHADYGFGLSLVSPDGVHKVAHNGAMLGYYGSAAYYPASGLTIVLLSNLGGAGTEAIERAIARPLLGVGPPPRTEAPLSAAERSRIAGTYDIGVFDVTLEERDGRLWIATPPPGPTTPLRHVGSDTFVSETDPDATYVVAHKDGSITVYMGAMHWYGSRR